MDNALKLLTLLEGEALAVWFELQQKDYKAAKRELVVIMVLMGFTSLEVQLDESVFVYLHDLKRLLDQALPDLEANVPSKLFFITLCRGCLRT